MEKRHTILLTLILIAGCLIILGIGTVLIKILTTGQDIAKPKDAVFYQSFEDATDADIAELIKNCPSWVKPSVTNTEYKTGKKALALNAYHQYVFIPIDKALLTPGTIYEFSMDWKLKELTDTNKRKIEKLIFVGYNPSEGEKLDANFLKTNGVYTYKEDIPATGDWVHTTLRFGNGNYDLDEQYGFLLRYAASEPFTDDDTIYLDNLAVVPAKDEAIAPINLVEEERTDDTVKVLAFGNSFSYDSVAWISHIARADGKDLRVANCSISGCSLQRHYKNIFNGNDDKYSFSYHTKAYGVNSYSKVSMQEALKATDWDCIVFQQASGQSYKFNTYEPYLTELIAYVKTFHPNVKIYFNQTWAYPDDSYMFQGNKTFDTDGDGNSEEEPMFEKVREAYLKASQNHGFTPLIPVGEAILRARKEMDRNLSRDGHHLDERGQLIAALIWYENFTGISALDNKVDLTNNERFSSLDITAAEQRIMKKIAHDTVTLYKQANQTQKP